MTNDELKKLRKKYNDLITLRKSVEFLINEKKELEKDPKIRRYLEINRILNLDNTYSFHGIEKENDSQIIERAISCVRPTNTKNIYIYMGTFRCNNEYDIIYGPDDTKVNRNDPKAVYSLYRNLELRSFEDNYEVKIGIKKREKFENDNIVIFPQENYSSDKFYHELRNAYFKEAIQNGQEKAFEKILYKRNMQKTL